MKVRRKSLWRSLNNRRAKFRHNQRAAKERKRIARAAREEPMPDLSHVVQPHPGAPLFIVSIRCRDGERVSFSLAETPWGLSVSPTLAGRKVATVLANYRPAA